MSYDLVEKPPTQGDKLELDLLGRIRDARNPMTQEASHALWSVGLSAEAAHVLNMQDELDTLRKTAASSA